jgi:hypothetical protein
MNTIPVKGFINVEAVTELAKQEGEPSVINMTTRLQAAAARVGDWSTLDALCLVKEQLLARA